MALKEELAFPFVGKALSFRTKIPPVYKAIKKHHFVAIYGNLFRLTSQRFDLSYWQVRTSNTVVEI